MQLNARKGFINTCDIAKLNRDYSADLKPRIVDIGTLAKNRKVKSKLKSD